jgi:hypothetical protein
MLNRNAHADDLRVRLPERWRPTADQIISALEGLNTRGPPRRRRRMYLNDVAAIGRRPMRHEQALNAVQIPGRRLRHEARRRPGP